MKTLRTSSYLRHVTRHHDSNLPLLKPPHTLTQRWRTMPPHDRATETTLSAQRPSARTVPIPLLQNPAPLSTQYATKLQPALPTIKIAQPVTGQEATSYSSTQSSRLQAPVAPSDSFPATEELAPVVRNQQPQMEIQPALAKPERTSSSAATEELAPTVRNQQPQVEIQLAPAKSQRTSSSPVTEELVAAKSTRSVAAETSRSSLATQVTSNRQTRASGEKKPVTLRPLSRQQQEATIPSTNSRHTADFAGHESNASTRAVEPQRRPAILPHKQETEQHTAIHIGTIDVHIVPPAPPAPLPPARGAAVRPSSTPALSREMTSFIGLRQG